MNPMQTKLFFLSVEPQSSFHLHQILGQQLTKHCDLIFLLLRNQCDLGLLWYKTTKEVTLNHILRHLTINLAINYFFLPKELVPKESNCSDTICVNKQPESTQRSLDKCFSCIGRLRKAETLECIL